MFNDKDLSKLYKQVGLQRRYAVGDLVVVEIEVGDFWIGEIWADSIDPATVRVLYGIYGSGEARNVVRKEFVRPATEQEVSDYRERQAQRGR